MKVLLSAYACNPNEGSEGGVGWNWLKELSVNNEIWVMFYAEQGQTQAIEKSLLEFPSKKNIHLVPVTVPNLLQNRLYRLRYEVWQWIAFQKARKFAKNINFDVVHHVTIATWWNCGYLWKLGIPFIFGPISGGQKTPIGTLSFLRPLDAVREVFRNFIVTIAWKIWARPRIAIRNAAIVLVANHETKSMISPIRKNKPIFQLSEVGSEGINPKLPVNQEAKSGINLLWVGQLIPRTNLGLLLEVLSCVEVQTDWHLRIVGEGPMKTHWKKKILEKGINKRVEFTGKVNHQLINKYYKWADIFVFTSIREATGTVVIEAMSYGVPVIALGINGANIVVSPGTGILIPITNRKQMIEDFASALLALARNPQKRYLLGKASVERIENNYLWEKRGQVMQEYYEMAVAQKE